MYFDPVRLFALPEGKGSPAAIEEGSITSDDAKARHQ
jgi:hypothetical protein